MTVLTSFDEATLREIGMEGSLGSRVVALARLARTAGMDGVVCSALEAPAVRRELGPDFKILVPGVRPASAATNDQSRIATPGDAVRAGADYLVVGRPITAAADPRAAALADRGGDCWGGAAEGCGVARTQADQSLWLLAQFPITALIPIKPRTHEYCRQRLKLQLAWTESAQFPAAWVKGCLHDPA